MSGAITVQEMKSRLEQGESLKMIDVRTPVEYREVHVPFAHLYPLDALDTQQVIQEMELSDDDILYIICQSGSRSRQAWAKFQDVGRDKVIYVEGGTKAWDEAGMDVQRGKKAISLERQVRMAAGFLILLGVGLGFGIHWGFFGISAFVGCGLMFAGITDTCGMAIMLSKMPWNNVKIKQPVKSCSLKPA